MSFKIIFNSDGSPIDIGAVKTRTGDCVELLGYNQHVMLIWCEQNEAHNVQKAATSDDHFLVIGRIRLDQRKELAAKLAVNSTTRDAVLCLQAYAKWGERCTDHLRGDFCFCIWDNLRQILFCARDQLGIRPLFYAKLEHKWLISDDPAGIAMEPDVSRELDDFWIADFLTTGFCIDSERTVYRDVRRLPPAHALLPSADGASIRKYWTFDIQKPIYFSKKADYPEQFRELVSLAIRDRLPDDCVGISLSGGLDSSALAALAVKVTGDPYRVVAETRYYSALIPDDEDYFSALVAQQLGIKHAVRKMDAMLFDRCWLESQGKRPQPVLALRNAETQQRIETEILGRAKVWFQGEGPDNALTFEWASYLRWLRSNRHWAQLATATVQYVRHKKPHEWVQSFSSRLPRLRSSASDFRIEIPPWLNADFGREVELDERLGRASGASTHPWLPKAMASFNSPIWQRLFDKVDPVMSGTRLDWRHPYLDLRVLNFLLAVPPIPWARQKLLIREAMRNYLPAKILARKKTPLRSSPVSAVLEKATIPALRPAQKIRQFVDVAKILIMPRSSFGKELMLRVYALNQWLVARGYG